VTPDVLLFDLDGTLTDPKAGIVGSLRFALDQLAVPCPTDDLLASYIGPPLRGTFATLLSTNESDRIEEAMRLYRQRFSDTGLYENRVYDGVPEMLERAGAAATAVYVATSKPAIYAERIVRHFGLAHYFRKVYGPELDGRYEDKAELLAHILTRERMNPKAAVMIGDRAADVRAAKANGVKSIGVLWGYGSERELIDAEADVLCATPRELVARLAAEPSTKSLDAGDEGMFRN
jgi:phosphoglycolate phosphatase